MSGRSQIETATGILAAEKLPLRAQAHSAGAALLDTAGAVVWSGGRGQIVAEVRRRVVDAVNTRTKEEAANMPPLPDF